MTPTAAVSGMPSASKPDDFISIVVPCYNEAANLPTLAARIEAALRAVPGIEYEVLIVDDGSSDNTSSVLAQLRPESPHISALRLVRNFGHQAALSAGLEHAGGDAVIVMDADLQHPPEFLATMIGRWRSGYEVVQGVRRAQPGLAKSLSSRVFYRLINWLSEVELRDGTADFRLLGRRALNVLLSLPEKTRFHRGLVSWMGFPCAMLEFDAPARQAGHTGYTLRKMFALAEDAVVSLSSLPLHFALYAAGLTLLAALAYCLFVVAEILRGVSLVRGWTSTILTVLLLGTANLLCTGILGMYLRTALAEVRRRPTYIVSEYVPAAIRTGQDRSTFEEACVLCGAHAKSNSTFRDASPQSAKAASKGS